MRMIVHPQMTSNVILGDNLNDNELEIYIALADLLSFLGEFNDSLSTLF